MGVFNFIINEIFGQGITFIVLIACIGLVLQKKSFSEIIHGTVMIAVGFFVLSAGTGLIIGNSIDGISTVSNTIMPRAVRSKTADIGTMYSTEIGIVIITALAVNLFIARFTHWRSIFLTGHMLYRFPYVFIATGVGAGLTGGRLIILATAFVTLYMVVSPSLMRPFVKRVTGDDSFTVEHPTACLSVLSGLLGRAVRDKEKSAEDLKIPSSLGFLREVAITGSFAIAITYIVMYCILITNSYDPAQVWEYAEGKTGIFTYIPTHAIYFGVGITITLQSVRILTAEIVPVFKGTADKFVPSTIPTLDVPVIFPCAPNTLVIGFLVAMMTSIITILLTAGMFPTVVIPLVSTCFFGIGYAAIIGNATGGVRGCVVGAVISGIIMMFLVDLDSHFFSNTIQQWMLAYGGQGFSLWGVIKGLITHLIGQVPVWLRFLTISAANAQTC